MAYLEAGTGKQFTKDQAAVYWDMLGDLPVEVLQTAARVALCEQLYPGLPSIGQLRQIAARVQAKALCRLTSIEAWRQVNDFANFFAVDEHGEFYPSAKRALERLDPLARATARAVGWGSIYNSPSRETLRAQFLKAYEALIQAGQQALLLPPSVQEAMGQLPQGVQAIAGEIGRAVE